MTAEIERLKPADFDKCGNIWDMRRHAKGATEWYRQLCDGTRATFVAREGDAFIGEISLVFDSGDPDYFVPGRRVYLSRLVVKDTCRRKGVGTRLCEHAFAHAKALGYGEMTLGVDLDNYAALRLYFTLGFETLLFVGEDAQGRYVKLLKRLN